MRFCTGAVMRKKHNEIAIRSKVWIEADGMPAFGRGRRFLLEAIAAHGSINQAAKEINISYRKAWNYITNMEERLGIRLVERQAGGRNGGGAKLTAEAEDFLMRYRMLEQGINEYVDRRFRKFFQGGGHV